MARKVAAQASGAVCNCARSAALEQQLAAEREARAAENCAKDALLEACQAELAAKQAQLEACQADLTDKEAQLQELRRDRFGRKTEVIDVGSADGAKPPASLPGGEADGADDPASLPGEDDPDQPPSGAGRTEPPQEGQRKRKRGRQPGQPNPGRTDRGHLPQRREVSEPQERACPDCGKPYRKDGNKQSTIYELQLEALARKIVRQRLRPQCDCEGARAVVGPPAPRLVPSTQLGTSVWTFCLVQVFALLRTQAKVALDLGQLGLEMKKSTLSAGLRRLSGLFEPLVAGIEQLQAGAAVLYVDETTWPVQQVESGGGRKRWWLWVCVTDGAVRMRILPTRGSPAAQQLLRRVLERGQGLATVVCDRWSAYKAMARRAGGAVRLAWCWAHQRRDFRRVGTGYPELEAWSRDWLQRIGKLFHLAKRRRAVWQPELPLAAQGPEFQAVQQRLEQAFASLLGRARRELERLASQWDGARGRARALLDAQGKALHSLLSHRDGLGVFVQDPRVAPDNNAAERALRCAVIGRKTSFGSGSEQGAHLTALLYSVYGTLQLWGLNYYAWTLDYLDACARNGGRPPENLAPWLPWAMDETRRAQLSQPPRLAGARPDRPASEPGGDALPWAA